MSFSGSTFCVQVEHDQALLRSRVERLSGADAVARFDEAVAAATPSTRPRSDRLHNR